MYAYRLVESPFKPSPIHIDEQPAFFLPRGVIDDFEQQRGDHVARGKVRICGEDLLEGPADV